MGNNNIDAIKKMILDENPDVVLFVEFSEEHSQALKDFFATHYPYSNNTSRSKIAVGSIVFSKYPIDNLADDFPQANWRYENTIFMKFIPHHRLAKHFLKREISN